MPTFSGVNIPANEVELVFESFLGGENPFLLNILVNYSFILMAI